MAARRVDAAAGRVSPRGARAGLAQQRADRRLGLVVPALAEVRVAHVAAGVDQVLGRPVLVALGVPGRHPVVLGDRVADALAADRGGDVAGVALERELRRCTPTIVSPSSR